jgi:uncharacterized Ntn-hydrolase superfamily protein
MTFSIVAFDRATGDLGVAVASKFPCVGAVVPWAKAGVGAVATQAWANPAFDRVLHADEGRDDRQAGFVDARGGTKSFTGSGCMDWAGDLSGEHFAVQGNILVGETVVAGMASAFTAAEGDLSDRLLHALLAGDVAGGDKRGKQSAAMLVVRQAGGYEGRNDRYIDLRVDDHPDAPAELARLFEVWDDTMLVRNDPLLEATPELVSDLQRRLAALGRYPGQPTGDFDDGTRSALQEWAGEVNLEGRLREDEMISRHLLRELRDITPDIR